MPCLSSGMCKEYQKEQRPNEFSSTERKHLHSQGRDFDTAVPLSQTIAIFPNSIEKLRRPHNDFIENNAFAGGNVLDEDMYASIQAEHQTRMCSIQHQISARQQDFTWRGDSHRTG